MQSTLKKQRHWLIHMRVGLNTDTVPSVRKPSGSTHEGSKWLTNCTRTNTCSFLPSISLCRLFLLNGCLTIQFHSKTPLKLFACFQDMPPLQFLPIKNRVPNATDYRCPCYKVVSRKGTLLTTGHSTNFVLYIEVPTDPWEGLLGGVR